jgi:hypothetical protein
LSFFNFRRRLRRYYYLPRHRFHLLHSATEVELL